VSTTIRTLAYHTSCNMAFLGQSGLVSLWYEVGLLERLLYKNKNQHRHTVHFQRLQQVRIVQLFHIYSNTLEEADFLC
jgi:hypothetical protein